MFLNDIAKKIDTLNDQDEEGITINELGEAVVRGAETVVAKKVAIGSVHRGTVNYARGMKAFQDKDVPDKNREAANSMRNLKDPDRLGLKRPEWNTSPGVAPNDGASRLNNEAMKFEIRNKLADTRIPLYKPNKIYSGCETRGVNYNWNVSNECQKPNYEEQRQKSLKNSQSQNVKKTYLDGKYSKPPTAQITAMNRNLHEEKLATEGLRAQIRQQYEHENKGSSEQKIEANVQRTIYEMKLKQKQAEVYQDEDVAPYKPQIQKTVPKKKYKTYYHTGVLEEKEEAKRNLEGEEILFKKLMWSCCMSEDPNDPGCNVRIVDKLRWQTNQNIF